MVIKLINKYLLALILFLAFLIRFYDINQLPSLNPDEAALGYNSYSLILTGKDEHGDPFPLHFKSFGDYKPGGYIYLDLPFIAVFGLTETAVRLPNLILSILTIFLVFKLILLLSSSKPLALVTSFCLSISPWHIHFSRGAWESSTALFFIIFGIYLFYKYIINHQKKYIYFFPIPLVFSLYTYHSSRIIVPLLFIILFIIYKKNIFSNIKSFLMSLTIAFLLTFPVLFSFINHGGLTRFSGVGLTADYGPVSRAEELINHHANVKLINRLIHNKRFLYLISWGENYLSHFDYNFLFLKGDEVPRSKSPDMGQLYLIELPLLILGLIKIIKSNKFHLKIFIFTLLFISPIASSLTFQSPSALRSLPMIIPLTVLVSFGIHSIFILKNRIINFVLILVYLFSFIFYLDAYFIHSPKRYPSAWNRGFSEIIPYINQNKNKFENIYVTNLYDQPYILYLFYSKYPPKLIQSQIKLTPADKFGFSTVNQIDNITFSIPESIPPNSLIIEASDYLSTQESFKIYTK